MITQSRYEKSKFIKNAYPNTAENMMAVTDPASFRNVLNNTASDFQGSL